MLPAILKTNLRQRAISDLTKEELQNLKAAIAGLQILDIDHVHESFLPWLAWWFRTEQWDDRWPIEQKRASVKESLVLFRYKGTAWAVERALQLSGLDATVIPWHAQTPVGLNGTFAVRVPVSPLARAIDGALQRTVASAIERNKRGSQHWDIQYEARPETPLYIAGYQKRIVAVTVGPLALDSSYGNALTAPYITTFETSEMMTNE